MDLYGLIHARFILSPRGLAMMKEKFVLSSFGYCPRVLCERQNVLPIGVSEDLSTSRVKVYCPRCQDVYIPRQKQLDIDGAYFGTSFPHVFLKVSRAARPTDRVCRATRNKCPQVLPNTSLRSTVSKSSACAEVSTSSSSTTRASQSTKKKLERCCARAKGQPTYTRCSSPDVGFVN